MKKILFLLFAAATLMARAADTKPVVCLIMDADSALIADATLTSPHIKDTLRSGCDGCISFIPDRARTRVHVEADGYVAANFVIRRSDAGKTLVLLLKPGPRKELVHGTLRGSKGPMGEDIYYTLTTATPKLSRSATAEGIYEAEIEIAAEEAAVYDTYAPADNSLPSAGKLTAGEVNDFAKWGLWPDILNGSHKEYVAKWGLYAGKRYAVQVTNRDGYPVSGMPVQLRTSAGEVIFSAVTDNTGKAELWNGLTAKAAPGELQLHIAGESMPARENRLNTYVTDNGCEAPLSADVFFVFDATGSMGDELSYLQAEMKDVIARSQTAVEGLTIRTGALVYRDFGDNYLTRIARLGNDINKTQAFIDKQEANGGGDYPEAIPEALLASLHVAGWNLDARARIAFLILDAPCHNDSLTLARLHTAVQEAASLGVRVVPVVCSGVDKDGELLMRSIALATNGTSFFLTDDSGIGNTHLKPTTDTLKVEHLNDMLVRTIIEFTRMPACNLSAWEEEVRDDDPIEQFLPNPTNDVTLPDAPLFPMGDIMRVRPNPCSDVCYVDILREVEMLSLADISGKTIYTFGRVDVSTASIPMQGLATGVYFVKAYVMGRWYTAKVIKI